MSTDRNEALRLADACKHGWLENVDPDKCGLDDLLALLRQQAERIAELEVARAMDTFGHNVMAGRAQLQMVRLESRLQSLTAERDQLRAEVERLKPNAERWEYALDSEEFAVCEWGTVFGELCWVPISEESAIDQARTTHKDEG